jgi:hypothetical protein
MSNIADTPLFTFGSDLPNDIKIKITDLVRTGFQEKYNELAAAVIYDITYRLDEIDAGTNGTSGQTGSQQILEFHTNKGVIDVPILGGGAGSGGIVDAYDVIYYFSGTNPIDNQQIDVENVGEALDAIFDPYTPPTGNTTGAPGTKEVGDSSFYPVNAFVTGIFTKENLQYVRLNEPSNLGGGSITNSSIPSASNGTVNKLYDQSSTPAISPLVPITYTWTGRVKDIKTSEKSAGSTTLRYVYPYYKFNNVNTAANQVNMQALVNSLINSSVSGTLAASAPSSIVLSAASTSQYMYIVIPDSWNKEVTEIIDTSLGLGSAPGWDTISAPTSSEFRRWDVSLTRNQTVTNGANWTNIDFQVYVSKIQKSNLSLTFKLG